MRINLGMSASSAEQVWARLAPEHGWDVRRLGEVVYLGPQSAARQLDGVLAARAEDVARLPQSQRGAWLRRRTLSWPRLAVPRELVAQLVQDNGWRLADAHRIPHDLWPAGQLHGLSLSEQLALLLIGFDLAYEIHPDTRTIQIVPLETLANLDQSAGPSRPRVEPPADSPRGDTRQVYSLRVAEKPVGAVIRELARKLNWQIEFDEPAIAAAGRSLDEPVSVAVENAEQDELLEAVLRPAGLTFHRDGEVLKVTPRQSAPVAP